MEKLTNKQEEILQVIKKFIAKNGYPPTVREIGKIVNTSSSATTHFHLTNLETKGYIKKGEKINRAIELLVPNEFIENNDSTVDVSLVGNIHAGNLSEALSFPDEYFTVPLDIINQKAEIFALKIVGESMIKAGIFDKDIVLIEKTNTANNGDIVIALNNDNEATVKTFYKEKNHFRLQPENDSMEPIILKEIKILGKVIGLYRKI